MNRFVIRQSLLLLLTATIWGVAFVSQSVGMDYVGPFTFNAARYRPVKKNTEERRGAGRST